MGMERIKIFMLAFLLLGMGTSAFSQVSEQEARAALQQRGIPEDTLRARLVAKGVNPDEITPDQLPQFQDILTETIGEIERDFRQRKQDSQKVAETSKPEPAPTVKPNEKEQKDKKQDFRETVKDTSVIYGHSIFREDNLFLKLSNTDIKPPEQYILGEGDEIGVAIFGASVLNETYEINRQGYITPAGMPRILLKGIPFGRAKELLRQNFARNYLFNKDQFEVTVSYARNITVNVLGEIVHKGSVTIPANNTVFNVLAAAGGMTNRGSVRRIKVISTDQERVVDLYAYLDSPTNKAEYYLNENDIVFVPAVQKLVEVKGAVNRPMKYELREGENLKKLIDFAGGLLPEAFRNAVRITRYLDDRQIVTSVNLKDILSRSTDYELYDGDVISIREVEVPASNYVSVEGAVLLPGEYERKDLLRVSDVLRQSGLKETARLDFGYLLRFNADSSYSYQRINPGEIMEQPYTTIDPVLRNMDRIVIQEESFYRDSVSFRVVGAVRNPGIFSFNPANNLNIDDAILLSGGLKPQAADFGFVVRKRPDEPLTTDYIPVNIASILSDANAKDNITLIPGDVVRIVDKENYRDEFYVKVTGAVRQPGVYAYDPNLQLIDLLRLAGGLRYSAATNKIDISRVILRDNDPPQMAEYTVEVDRDLSMVSDQNFGSLQPFDHIYVREIPDFDLQKTVILQGEVQYPGEYTLTSNNERLASLISRAGGLSEEANPEAAALFRAKDSIGFVVIQLDRALSQPNSSWNIILDDMDTVYIPRQEDLVLIEGAINAAELYREEYLTGGNQIAVNFEGEKSALYYVNEYAAGVSDDGSKNLITVEQANGKIEKARSFLFFRSYPKVKKGARIKVGKKPEKVRKEREEKEPVDWNNVVRDVLAQATAIMTLILLANNINR